MNNGHGLFITCFQSRLDLLMQYTAHSPIPLAYTHFIRGVIKSSQITFHRLESFGLSHTMFYLSFIYDMLIPQLSHFDKVFSRKEISSVDLGMI